MLLGAWMACGVELSALEEQVGRLGLEGVRWSKQQVKRGALVGTRVTIESTSHQHSRGYSQIEALLRAAPLSPRVQDRAVSIFRRLGEVEAALHGVPLERVHFHEVGAVDSIADIVGTCAALELLGIDELHCSPLNLGSGTVKTDHGLLPVPAPATAELLKGLPVYSSGVAAELVTPTGAAIVSTLAKSFGALPAMKIEKVGYGAGSGDFPGISNVLRVLLGEARIAELGRERLVMLEAALDDMNPQVCGFFSERAFAAGALDVFFAPVQMKKNRPGVLLSVLCRPEQQEMLMDLFFQETPTLGVRGYEVFRCALEREFVPVETSFGPVRMKVSRRNGRVLNFTPEFEDCRRLAEEHAVPLRTILQEATFAFWKERGVVS
jgi:hypothetical protein